MSDNYKELLIRNKVRASGIVIRVLLVLLIVLLVFAGLMYPICLLLAIGAGVGAYFAFMYTAVEYEYLILNKEISVDKIFGQSKRKNSEVLELGRIEILAPATSHELDNYHHNKVKTTDYSAGADLDGMKLYEMYYEGNRRILLNLDAESVKMIKNYAPRKVFDY